MPKVVASAPKVVVSEWVNGIPLSRLITEGSQEERNAAAPAIQSARASISEALDARKAALEAAALEDLQQMGAQVRVSYDTSTTRLHAKAWLFHRDSGFSTAYVGSSNLTHSAQVTGLEWNVRFSAARNPHVLDKMAAVFESYWHSGDFIAFGYDRPFMSLVFDLLGCTQGVGGAVAWEYWNGSAWVAYTTGNYVAIPSDGDGTANEATSLLVRVAITNDTVSDNGETFTLTATNTGGTGATGTGTIMDDGTGTLFPAANPVTTGGVPSPVVDTTSTLNDDRPLSVNNLTVNEGEVRTSLLRFDARGGSISI